MPAKTTLDDLVSESSLETLAGTGKGTDFAPYLETLRTQYKAKRNFMQRLEAVAAERAKKGISQKRVQ